MLLAIVIPYYNYIYFKETLDSLASQTNNKFNVYIGDDASSVSPLPLLENYKGKFNFEYKRFQTNLGGMSLVKQWERCIEMVKGEKWIMILGDDDLLGSNVIDSWYLNFNKFNKKTNLVRYATKVIYQEKDSISKTYNHPIWEKESTFFTRLIKSETRSSLSEYFFSRASYNKFGFKEYILGWGSDCNAWLDFPDKKLIFSINEAIAFIRISKGSISGNEDVTELKSNEDIKLFKDIINNKFNLFEKNQKLELILMLEVTIKNSRKLTFQEWLFLFKLYLVNFNFLSLIKFIRRFIIVLFNLKK